MALETHEFIRRFLLHVLPDGFMRIRHFGFLANRSKKHALAQCRKLLDFAPPLPKSPILSAKDLLLKITGIDLSRCPCCREGTMIVVGVALDGAAWRGWCLAPTKTRSEAPGLCHKQVKATGADRNFHSQLVAALTKRQARRAASC